MTRVNGNSLTPEEIKLRKEAFQQIKENGHSIILTARSGNHSGVSYDYMDRLNKDIEAGIFEDNNKDGQKNKFSDFDKRNLGKEFKSVFTEHGYSTNFTKMQVGNKYEISYDDYIKLANAAGYTLKKETEENIPAKIIKQDSTSNSETTQENQKLDSNPISAKNVHSPDKISMQATPSKEAAEIKEAKNITPQVKNPKTAEEKLIEAINSDPLLAGKSPEEMTETIGENDFNALMQIEELEKTYVTETKPRFLGLGKKEYQRNLTPEEINERQEKIQELEKQRDKYKKYKTYIKGVQTNKFWFGLYGSQELKDEKGNIVNSYPLYDRVTVINDQGKEQRVARVSNYDPETLKTTYQYYSIDIQKVGDPSMQQGIYYSVVPDLNNELKNVELKNK